MAFLMEIAQAYEAGDLTREPILRKAMMFENYDKCPVAVRDRMTALPEWPGLDADSRSPGYALGSESIFSVLKGQGTPYVPQERLHHVVPTRSIRRYHKFPRNLLAALQEPGSHNTQRVKQFEDAVWRAWWDTVDSQGRLIWLFHDGSEEPNRTLELLQDLGLHHYGERSADDSFFKLTFTPKECNKPNWVDADLAFYFYQTSDSRGHGWTRSLRTGEQGYQELVRRGMGELELIDVRVLVLEADHHFARLSDRYRKVQQTRIEGRR